MNRKFRLIFLAFVCCLILCGCKEQIIRGEVVEVNGDSFLFVSDGTEAIKVTTGSQTRIFSWTKDITVSDFWAQTVDGIVVTVNGRLKEDTMYANEVQIEGRLFRNEYTLSDGTGVDLFKASLYSIYSLTSGEELLFVHKTTEVDEAYVQGIGALTDLTEPAQENIKAWYHGQGLMYDVHQVLEEAYAAWLVDGDGFQTYTLGQETCPAASNEEVIYFLTIVSRPKTELRLCAAFDRETGEAIPMEEIFTCEPREFIQRLAKIAGIDDETLVEEMMEAFQTEYVTVSQNFLEVNFPAGTLPSEELPLGMGFEYTQDVCELIQPWAIPNGVTG